MSQYIRYPSPQSGNTITEYPTLGDFPAVALDGSLALALDTDTLYVFNTSSGLWTAIASPGSVLGIGTFDGNTASSNGLSIATNLLYAQSASDTVPGMVNTTAQTFLGNKYFPFIQTGNGTSLTEARIGSTSKLINVGSFISNVAYSGASPTLLGYKANGTEAVPTATTANQIMFSMSARGHDGTDFVAGTKARVALMAGETWTSTANGTYITLATTPLLGTTITERMRIFADGNISIGNTTSSAKLAVTGDITATTTIAATGNLSGANFSGSSSGTNTGDQTITLTSEATGSGTGSFAVTLDNTAVISKVLTGYTSGAGTVAATDTILQAIQKLNGNTAAVSGAVTSISAFGSSPNSAGGTVSSNSLVLQPASATQPGGISTTTQTLAGVKTFVNNVFITTPSTLQIGTTTGVFNTSEQLSNLYTVTSPAALTAAAFGSEMVLTGNSVNTVNARGARFRLTRTTTGVVSESGGLFGFSTSLNINNGANAYTNTLTSFFSSAISVGTLVTGASAPTMNYAGIGLNVDATTVTGYKVGFFTGGVSGGTNNALFADNIAFSGDFGINIASTNANSLGGNLAIGGAFSTNSYDTSAATSGTITASANKPGLLITGAGGTTLTIRLPSSPIDGQQYWVASQGAFTTVTWQDAGGTAGNVIGGQAAIGGTVRGQVFVYSTANTKWFSIS